MSELLQRVKKDLDMYGFHVLKTFKGRAALNKAVDTFFNTDKEWASQWSSKDVTQSAFIVYERMKRTRKYIGFKFVIGDIDTGSVLGEEHLYDEDIAHTLMKK